MNLDSPRTRDLRNESLTDERRRAPQSRIAESIEKSGLRSESAGGIATAAFSGFRACAHPKADAATQGYAVRRKRRLGFPIHHRKIIGMDMLQKQIIGGDYAADFITQVASCFI